MIVKNESRVITRLLESVVNLVDCYCICDTGSTDDTIDIIRQFFDKHGIPGKIIEESFKDFGYNRTFALKACNDMDTDYILLMDADMVLTGEILTTPDVFKRSLVADVYHVCQGNSIFFYKNTRIVKNNPKYSYWGVTHEYVNTPEGTVYAAIENSQLFINDIGDGGSKADKFLRDIRLLKKGLEELPNNDRYTFYLANSYRDSGQHENAIDTYKKRIAIGGWVEEIWHSYYSIGRCYKKMDDYVNAIHWWMEAYNYYPRRIEALYEIIHYYRINGKNQLAYFFYVLADEQRVKYGASVDFLFLEKDVYDYKIDYELTIIGYYINNKKYDLNRYSMKVLTDENADQDTKKNVLSNYKFYSKKLIDSAKSFDNNQLEVLNSVGDSIRITDDPTFKESTPTICRRGNHLIINKRYVNYQIDENGGYKNQDHIHTRNVVAIIDISTPFWNKTQEFELKYDDSIDNLYIGLEDIRIHEYNNIIYYNCNRGLSYHNIAIEHGIFDLGEEKTDGRLLQMTNQENIEKNWVLFNYKGNMKAIYNWLPITIGNITEENGEQILEITDHKTSPPFFKYVRGSTNGVEIGNEIWFICHSVSYEDRRYYYHIIVVLDKETLELKKYTPFFTFEGEKVEYTLGFVYFEETRELLVGYSLYDKISKWVKIGRDYFENMFLDMKLEN